MRSRRNFSLLGVWHRSSFKMIGGIIPDREQRSNISINITAINMKIIKLLSGICLLTAMTCFAEDLSEADKKWSRAVESKIAQGAATISTPSESRAKLAQELANKHGRSSKVEKTDTGYRIVVDTANTSTQTAAK